VPRYRGMSKLLKYLLILFSLYYYQFISLTPTANAYLIFNRNGSITQINNSTKKKKNLIAFRQNGSIQILSTKELDTNLAEYVDKNNNYAVLGSNNEIEARQLIEKNGEIRISRNQDKSITLTLLDQNNPDVVFENQTETNLPQSQSLVYLEILPSPITISNESGDLYLTQDVFKVKVDHEFDAFVIRSSPENIFITSANKEYKMETQPIDVGRILSASDNNFEPKLMIEQKLNITTQPNYQINSQRQVLSVLNKPLFCNKNYQVAFQSQDLLTTSMPLTSYLTCLFSR